MLDHDHYLEMAIDQRCNDFDVVRNWVFEQIDHNLPQFAHDIACMLVGAEKPSDDPEWDYRLADHAAVDAIRTRMGDAIAAQPETEELAQQLENDAKAEEADTYEDDYWYGNPYLEACHDAEVRAAKLCREAYEEYRIEER